MKDWIIQFACSLVVLAVIAVAYHLSPPKTRGANWIPHAVAVVALILIEVLLPYSIAHLIFTPLTSVLAGCVFPVYESIRAVCTPDEEDDKAWLQYWLVGGVLFMATEWVGRAMAEESTIYWYEATVFLFVWLFHPVSDGAALIYDKVTEPFITPRVKPLQAKMNNFIQAAYQLLMNAVHLWFLWIIFLFLPQGLKRTVAILIGTVYPLICSIGASATEEVEDDTYWLTYWSVYGTLFILMDILEVWIGWIPGFYTLVIFTTVYLMLPMFQGADKLFRKVLVPLAGLQELLMLRDAIQVKKQVLRDLPPERASKVRAAIAKFYADDNATRPEHMEDLGGSMKQEYMASWRDIRLSNPFSRSSDAAPAAEEAEPGETTNLV